MGNVKLYARVPKLADDAEVLLWEPWRAVAHVEGIGIWNTEIAFPPIPVHHANRSLSCLWVASEDCPKCHGTGDAWNDKAYEASPCLVCGTKGIVGPTGEGRDATGNSVRLELPPLEIGYLVTQKTVRNEDRGSFNYGAAGYMDCLQWPPRLVTAPMQVKMTVKMSGGNLTVNPWPYLFTVSLPARAVRHPLFPCEGEGVWSQTVELKCSPT
jgi:hypothetical protein